MDNPGTCNQKGTIPENDEILGGQNKNSEEQLIHHELKSVDDVGITLNMKAVLAGIAVLGSSLDIVQIDGHQEVYVMHDLVKVKDYDDFRGFEYYLEKFEVIYEVPVIEIDGLNVNVLVCTTERVVDAALPTGVAAECYNGFKRAISMLDESKQSRRKMDWSYNQALSVYEDDWDEVSANVGSEIKTCMDSMYSLNVSVYFFAARHKHDSNFRAGYDLPNIRCENGMATGIICSYEFGCPGYIIFWKTQLLQKNFGYSSSDEVLHVGALKGLGELHGTECRIPNVRWYRYIIGLFRELDDELRLFSSAALSLCVARLYNTILNRFDMQEDFQLSETENAILGGWFIRKLKRMSEQGQYESPAIVQTFYRVDRRVSESIPKFSICYEEAFKKTRQFVDKEFEKFRKLTVGIPSDFFAKRNARILKPIIATLETIIEKVAVVKTRKNTFELGSSCLMDRELFNNFYTANALLIYYVCGYMPEDYINELQQVLGLASEEMRNLVSLVSTAWPFESVDATFNGITSPLATNVLIPGISKVMFSRSNTVMQQLLVELFNLQHVKQNQASDDNPEMLEVLKRFCTCLLEMIIIASQTICVEVVLEFEIGCQRAVTHWNNFRQPQSVVYWTADHMAEFLLSHKDASIENPYRYISMALFKVGTYTGTDVVQTALAESVEQMICGSEKPFRLALNCRSQEAIVLPVDYKLYTTHGVFGSIWSTAFKKWEKVQDYPLETNAGRTKVDECFSRYEKYVRREGIGTPCNIIDIFGCVELTLRDQMAKAENIGHRLREMQKREGSGKGRRGSKRPASSFLRHY